MFTKHYYRYHYQITGILPAISTPSIVIILFPTLVIIISQKLIATILKTSTAVNESRNDYMYIPANCFSSNFFQKLLKSIFLLHVTYRLVDFII